LVVLTLAAVGVLLAAADTYVIVLALPDIMVGVGLDVQELQRAAPLISMFLLGYVVVLPLAGRISDLAGRLPVLIASLLVFAAGSLLTAAADGLAEAVAGRFLQGVGGGALVPVTLALVADLWPVHRRGVPLGVVGAVQELGAVMGPLYGAVIIAVADWRAIFWINLALGLVLAVAMLAPRHGQPRPGELTSTRRERRSADWAEVMLLTGAVAAGVVAVVRPAAIEASVRWGELLLPLVGQWHITTPVALAAVACTTGFVVRDLTSDRPLLGLRAAPRLLRAADLPGAGLLGIALGAIVLTFSVADPEVEFMTPAGPWLLALSAVALVTFAWRQRRARAPLVPAAAVRPRAAWGALAVSLFVGAALVAILIDVPVLARTVISGADQFDAALVLVQFLIALPIGALLGGWLTRRFAPAWIATAGMALATVGLAVMSTWGVGSLQALSDTAILVIAGLGFGLAIAPINAALLAATPKETHGVASALIVTSRMVGMLAGLSALTAIGLRRLYAYQATIESPAILCPESPTRCPEYDDAVREAIVAQLQATFTGATVCAGIAAVGAAVLLRPVAVSPPTKAIP
jgi:MFS family permease